MRWLLSRRLGSRPCRGLLLCRFEDLEAAHQRLIHAHHSTGVIELTAILTTEQESETKRRKSERRAHVAEAGLAALVARCCCACLLFAYIWCAEYGDESSLCKELISVLDDLMRSAHEVEVVLLEEFGHHIAAERERHTSIVLTPAFDVLVRIAPQQIANDARIRHVSGARDASNLVHAGVLGGEAAVHAEDLGPNTQASNHEHEQQHSVVSIWIISRRQFCSARCLMRKREMHARLHGARAHLLVDDGGDGKAVEAVREGLPQLDVVATLAYSHTTHRETEEIKSKDVSDKQGKSAALSAAPSASAAASLLPRFSVPLTLVVESIDAVDGCALVIAAEQEEVLKEKEQEREKEERQIKSAHATPRDPYLSCTLRSLVLAC